MRDLPWKFFALTGNIETYMLYKEHQDTGMMEDEAASDDVENQEQ